LVTIDREHCHKPLGSAGILKEFAAPSLQDYWRSMKVSRISFGRSYDIDENVRFGDSFGLGRWPDWGDADFWQFGISGAVLAQLNLDADSMELINADYFFALRPVL
jgi:hypothetical protein